MQAAATSQRGEWQFSGLPAVIGNDAQTAVRRRGPQPLVVLATVFAIGIGLDRVGPLGDVGGVALLWWTLAVLCLVAWWSIWQFGGHAIRERAALATLLASCLFCGSAWHHVRWRIFDSDEIGRYVDKRGAPACVEGIAVHSPRTLPPLPPSPYRAIPVGERSQLEVAVTAIRVGRQWKPAAGKARLSVHGHLLGVGAGDRLRIFAQLEQPRRPRNPGEFDLAAHARAERRLTELRCGFPECVQVLEVGAWYLPRRILDRIQRWCVSQFQRQLGPDEGAIAAALILGAREGISAEHFEAYRRTGTIHVLVVSGLHVGILAVAAYFVVALVCSTRRGALLATGLVVVGFATITGGRPPVVRATVGTLAALGALLAGRRVLAYNVVAAAALVVLAINPCELFRVGTQLSFLAAATLVWCGQRMRATGHVSELDRLQRQSRPLAIQVTQGAAKQVARLWAVTGCLWLVALPLVMQQFHLLTPVAVLAAPVVGIIAWVSLTSGFVLLAIGWLLRPAAPFLERICGGSIDLLREVVAWAESVPGGYWWVSGPSVWWTIGMYGLLAAFLTASRWIPLRWRISLVAIWITVGFSSSIGSRHPEDELTCTILSVGHGTCIVLQAPGGRTILYDAGSLGAPELTASTISSFLWSEGVTSLDGIILSHADVDHFNSVPPILQQIKAAAVFTSTSMFDPITHPDEGSAPRVLQRELEAAGLTIATIQSGDRLALGEQVTADVLHPPAGGVGGNDNANSVVLGVQFAGRRILLTGDLESPGLEEVLAEMPFDVDALLAPHHGSRFSDPAGLAQWCRPEWVVISGGDEGRAAEAVRTYTHRGAEVLQTLRDNAIRIRISQRGLFVENWEGGRWRSRGRSSSARGRR